MTKIKLSQYFFIIIVIVASLWFWQAIWSKVLIANASGWFSACPNCWGDWCAHLTYTASFAWADNWPPALPIFWGHKFTYPFIADLISAGLVRLGLALPQSLVWPGFILSLLTTGLVYSLAKTLTDSRLAAIITILIFLFSGGAKNSAWLNVIDSQLLPQRGILLGLPLAIIAYWFLWRGRPTAAGLIAGFLPLIHFHSYLMVLAAGFLKGRRFFLPALALGLPQIGWLYDPVHVSGFLAPDWFWLKQWREIWPVVFIMSLGLAAAPKKLKQFSLPFWLVFIAASFFRFQPWAWDNSKLLIHWYLISAISAGRLFSRRRLVGLICLPLLIFPGIQPVTQIIKSKPYQFFSADQLTAAKNAAAVLPSKTLVLTAANHNHWLPALTGRQILMGYPGWLWTYGIDYQQRQSDVIKIYQGDAAALSRYPIEFIVIGSDEKTLYPDLNEAYFLANFPLVFDQNGYKIFQVK